MDQSGTNHFIPWISYEMNDPTDQGVALTSNDFNVSGLQINQ